MSGAVAAIGSRIQRYFPGRELSKKQMALFVAAKEKLDQAVREGGSPIGPEGAYLTPIEHLLMGSGVSLDGASWVFPLTPPIFLLGEGAPNLLSEINTARANKKFFVANTFWAGQSSEEESLDAPVLACTFPEAVVEQAEAGVLLIDVHVDMPLRSVLAGSVIVAPPRPTAFWRSKLLKGGHQTPLEEMDLRLVGFYDVFNSYLALKIRERFTKRDDFSEISPTEEQFRAFLEADLAISEDPGWPL